MTYKKALTWSVFWIISAFIFAFVIGYYEGQDNAFIFLTGYIVEKMLSFDNLFMFYLIFKYLNLSPNQQRTALNIGIIGAVALRGLFIFSGCFLINKFNWLLYLFGLFLVYSGIKLFISNDEENNPSEFVEKIKINFPSFGLMALTIITIEITDLLFALDSIPAILSITQNSFLILSSNIFAILGLRSLYFVMLGLIKKFTYLQYSVGTILTFIGMKMLMKPWYNVSIVISLSFILITILFGIILSRIKKHDSSS